MLSHVILGISDVERAGAFYLDRREFPVTYVASPHFAHARRPTGCRTPTAITP